MCEEEYQLFHESVIPEIEVASHNGLATLASLLLRTRIRDNHAAIAAAWQERSQQVAGEEDMCGVAANILRRLAARQTMANTVNIV